MIDPREAEAAVTREFAGVRTPQDAERAAAEFVGRRLKSEEDVPLVEDFPLVLEEETPEFGELATTLQLRGVRALDHWQGNTHPEAFALQLTEDSNAMKFPTEPHGYQKTTLSDLQGAWQAFRESVVDTGGFEDWDRVLFHTDEAMSWETVRNLDRMPALVLIIRNLCLQSGISGEVMENLEEVTNILEETLREFPS